MISKRTIQRIYHRTAALLIASLLSIGGLAAASVTAVRQIPAESRNHFYPCNRPPLLPDPVIKLPPGSVTPTGWLHHILMLEARGYVGHLDHISDWCNYRISAWVHADGKGQNGFEEVPYWLRGLGDLGYVTGDKRIIKKAEKWLAGVMRTARPDGYFGPASNLHDMPDGRPDCWPDMPMIEALRSYYEYSHDPKVIKLLLGYFHWMMRQNHHIYTDGWGATRWSEDTESIYWLYNRTGRKFLLTLAARIEKDSHGAGWKWGITSTHGVNFGEGFRQPAEYYMQSHKLKDLDYSIRDYAQMHDIYGQVPGGGYGADESGRFGFTGPRQAIETCAIVENMASDEEMDHITGSPYWADRCEDIAFNMLPSASTPDLTAIHYLTAPNQIALTDRNMHPYIDDSGNMFAYSNSGVFRCCEHNFGYGWPYFAESLWGATSDDGAVAMMYSASVARIRVGSGESVRFTESTGYPFRGTIRVALHMKKSDAFPLYMRIPYWCHGATVEINGKTAAVHPAPDQFVRINRRWHNGDTVTLHLPRKIRITFWKRNHDAASVGYGPLDFSLNVGEKWKRYGTYHGTAKWEVLPTTQWNYGLVLNHADPAASFKVVYRPGPIAPQPFTPQTAPIELLGTGRQIPEWKENQFHMIGSLHQSPVISTEPNVKISMIPMGAARLRVSVLPVIATGGEHGHYWTPPAHLIARVLTSSPAAWPFVARSVMFSTEPASSRDQYVPAYTWWGTPGRQGWIEYMFSRPVQVSSTAVYWFDDKGRSGHTPYPGAGWYRTPESWSLQYTDGKGWKPVHPEHGTFGLALNTYNRVKFRPRYVLALRLKVNFRPGHGTGLYRWKVYDRNLQLIPTVSPRAVAILKRGDHSAPSWMADQPITAFRSSELAKSLTNGMGVQNWQDEGYGGFDAHPSSHGNLPTLAKRGIDNRAAVHFKAADRQMLMVPRPVQNNFTIALIFDTHHKGDPGNMYYQGAGLVQGDVPGVVPDFGISLNSHGQVLAGTGDPDTTIASQRDLDNGRPHLVVFTRSRNAGRITLYIDGRRVASAVAGTEKLNAPGELGIGGHVGGYDFYSGYLGEIKFFRTALKGKRLSALEHSMMKRWGIAAN